MIRVYTGRPKIQKARICGWKIEDSMPVGPVACRRVNFYNPPYAK